LPMDGFPSDGVLNNDHLGTLMPFGAPSTPSFIIGLANEEFRPQGDLQDRAMNGREVQESRL
jgi:hypothetical protein